MSRIPSFKLTLEKRASPHVLETKPRYDVLVNGEKRGELYYNMRRIPRCPARCAWLFARSWRGPHHGLPARGGQLESRGKSEAGRGRGR